MWEKRSHLRLRRRLPIRFRIVKYGAETVVSDTTVGYLRDVSPEGLAMETERITVDGLHLSYDDHPLQKNKIYLQMELPGMGSFKAVGETVWYQRTGGPEGKFLVGLRLVELTPEDREKLVKFLSTDLSHQSIFVS